MAGVSDYDNLAALTVHLDDFNVNFGHQWTGRIKDREAPAGGFLTHRLRHTMRAEDNNSARWNVRDFFDEHRALLSQVIDDEGVMHDLVSHIDGSAVQRDGALNDLYRTVDTGAEAAWIRKDYFQSHTFSAAERGAGIVMENRDRR